MDKNGVRVENKVVTKKGKTYYFGADGKALTGMRKVGRKYYYFSTTSFAMEKNYKYVAANGSIYYFGSKGYRAKNKFITLTENGGKNTYYFGKMERLIRAGTPSKEKILFLPRNGCRRRSTCAEREPDQCRWTRFRI